MNKLERFIETTKDLYIEKSTDKKIEELCESLEPLKGKYDRAIVVLAGGLSKVKAPSGQEHIKTEFAAHMRATAAVLKYKELSATGHHAVILVSGGKCYGKGDNMPILSEVMKTELIRNYGINPTDIVTEPHSIDTSQNARFSSKLLEALGFHESKEKHESREKAVCLITNQFHLERANLLFNRHFKGGLEPINAEKVLINFMRKLSDGSSKTPYKKVIENYLISQRNQDATQQDKKILAATKLPFGEKAIEALAYYLRSSEEEKKIPLIKQPKKDSPR